jgi:hypothetical protein
MVWSGPALGEEILLNRNGKHLGWRVAANRFATCAQAEMEIGEGRIERTDEKCPEHGNNTLVASGDVEFVDVKNRTLRVRDESDKLHELFYPVRAELKTEVPLTDVEVGSIVMVWGPVRGRADRIIILDPDETCES